MTFDNPAGSAEDARASPHPPSPSPFGRGGTTGGFRREAAGVTRRRRSPRSRRARRAGAGPSGRGRRGRARATSPGARHGGTDTVPPLPEGEGSGGEDVP